MGLLTGLGKTIRALSGAQSKCGHAEHRFWRGVFSVSATALFDLVGRNCLHEPHLQVSVGNAPEHWLD